MAHRKLAHPAAAQLLRHQDYGNLVAMGHRHSTRRRHGSAAGGLFQIHRGEHACRRQDHSLQRGAGLAVYRHQQRLLADHELRRPHRHRGGSRPHRAGLAVRRHPSLQPLRRLQRHAIRNLRRRRRISSSHPPAAAGGDGELAGKRRRTRTRNHPCRRGHIRHQTGVLSARRTSAGAWCGETCGLPSPTGIFPACSASSTG